MLISSAARGDGVAAKKDLNLAQFRPTEFVQRRHQNGCIQNVVRLQQVAYNKM